MPEVRRSMYPSTSRNDSSERSGSATDWRVGRRRPGYEEKLSPQSARFRDVIALTYGMGWLRCKDRNDILASVT